MHGWVIDFERGLVAAVVDIGGGLLHRVVAGNINAMHIHLSNAIGHHVYKNLGDSRCIFYPNGFGVPQSPGLR